MVALRLPRLYMGRVGSSRIATPTSRRWRCRVLFTDFRSPIKTVRLRGCYPEQLSVSSGAEHLALTTSAGVPGTRLIVLNPWTGELQRDITDLAPQFRSLDIERVRISADGRRLAIGTREHCLVVDVPSGKVLFDSMGRFPCLSPEGDSVAFINKEQELVVASVITRANKKLVKGWWATLGLGCWSPDGMFLLAGIRGRLSFFVKLVAIDCATGEFTQLISRLQEGDLGEQSAWVNRHLLTRRTDTLSGR